MGTCLGNPNSRSQPTDDPSTLEPVVSVECSAQHTSKATPSTVSAGDHREELSDLKMRLAQMQHEYESKYQEFHDSLESLKQENAELRASKLSAENEIKALRERELSMKNRMSNNSNSLISRRSKRHSGRLETIHSRDEIMPQTPENTGFDISLSPKIVGVPPVQAAGTVSPITQPQDPNMLSPLSDSHLNSYQMSLKNMPTGSCRSVTTIYDQSSSDEELAFGYESGDNNAQVTALREKLTRTNRKLQYFETECEKLMLEIQDSNQWKSKYEQLSAEFAAYKENNAIKQ